MQNVIKLEPFLAPERPCDHWPNLGPFGPHMASSMANILMDEEKEETWLIISIDNK